MILIIAVKKVFTRFHNWMAACEGFWSFVPPDADSG